jgi:hypothetical protein
MSQTSDPPGDAPIELGARFVASRDIVSCDLDTERIVLNLGSGIYHSIDGVGRRIWELVQEPRSVREIRDTLIAEFEVEEQQCEADLLAFLCDLESAGLVHADDEIAA